MDSLELGPKDKRGSSSQQMSLTSSVVVSTAQGRRDRPTHMPLVNTDNFKRKR